MPKLSAGVVLALIICSLPALAQQGSVVLSVCNKGAVDFDVFLSFASRLDGGHVASGACSRVYAEVGQSPPAYLGFAFVDSAGKWGAAKKLDLLPDLGAIKFQDMVDRGEVRDYADLARLGYVSRARVTQIMNWLLLAPDLQERLLLSQSLIQERRLREVVAFVEWRPQRECFSACAVDAEERAPVTNRSIDRSGGC